MEDWFTVENIDKSTFAISEYGHWEKTHSYLLLGTKYALLIDTGLGIGNIKKEVNKLTNLPVKVVTTHVHWDHIGGHKFFNNIYVHENDAQWLRNGLPIPISVIRKNIIKEPFTKKPPEEFDINKYFTFISGAINILKDRDIINIGARELDVIHTPGHSPGHICLFEEKTGYLFTGDLIYLGTLYAFYPSTNPKDYKNSIDKISKLKGVIKILPGHNDLEIPKDIIQRVKHAFQHLEDIKLLSHGSGTFNFGDFNIQL
ncbi:MBL fold metallo-hydrolase [Clostridium sp. JN-9]|uniref:MBL fold metallo-hydrolase n=1 Tax=Clostridium sp. JN-9 TaxID=2507159 RepID=UPI000FFE20A1|nr:MBL fold metallo-hydrolase [Clostridium sp. JN-9]QAT39652.1 MBL fold metallo-hydrolase [Clostridium sp. JN-9]